MITYQEILSQESQINFESNNKHLLDLRREGHFSDVTLDVFGTQIKAHKVNINKNIFCSMVELMK